MWVGRRILRYHGRWDNADGGRRIVMETRTVRIGYACVNTEVGMTMSRTFRVASYTPERFLGTIASNLDALDAIIRRNIDHDIRYFRISSGLIPLASHPVIDIGWKAPFADTFRRIGERIRDAGMRVTMHPGQYTLLNSPKPDVVGKSLAELAYHADVLDLLGADLTAKIQIHTDGVYGDRAPASARFVEQWRRLPDPIRRRLAIENDERNYGLADNLAIHGETGIPLIFDTFHHSILHHGETLEDALDRVAPTWTGSDGPMMVDYSTQDPAKRVGAHAMSIDPEDFRTMIPRLRVHDPDVMLEIKDKQSSALIANALQDGTLPT